jgi:lysozyme family protein
VTDSIESHYSAAFHSAAARVLSNEGGFTDDPADRGGATKFGISQRQYPELNIAELSREEAIAIYYRDWWRRFDYEELPAAIGAKVLDLAVNVGPAQAARCLQRALRACGIGVEEDGVLGPGTRVAARGVDVRALIAALRSEAAGHYRLIASTRHAGRANETAGFLKGWLRRAYQ